jgi:hypothetical protein
MYPGQLTAKEEKAPDVPIVCPSVIPPAPTVARSEVYKAYPFKQGEEAKYELRYGVVKVLVGYGFMRVMPPIKHEIITARSAAGPNKKDKVYHMVFDADAYTGDWYKAIFRAHNKVQALSRPWDFAISRFYINQDEEKPFVRRFRKERWLDYQQADCKTYVKEKDYIKDKEKNEEFDLQYGATDALGAVYKLRGLKFELGKPQKFLVYSSEKNWILEAVPKKIEKVEVKAGKFEAIKLSMKTYIGQELSQKGNLDVWIATQHPSHPMVKVEGEAKFGKFYLELDSFRPGS